jgi:hypothetical protein
MTVDSCCFRDGECQMKTISRTRSVGTKVTQEEHEQLRTCASENGQSVSEWCRSVLLGSIRVTAPTDTDRVLLAEVLALRTILLNLHFAMARSETISADDMQAIIDRADHSKEAKAAERLARDRDVQF